MCFWNTSQKFNFGEFTGTMGLSDFPAPSIIGLLP